MEHRRFLFVLWNGGGNVPPMLRMARRLIAAGHRVTVLGNSSLRAAVDQAGVAFRPFAHGPRHDPGSPDTDCVKMWEATSAAHAAQIARDRMLFGPSHAVALDTIDAIAHVDPDAICVDYSLLGGLVAAEASTLPTAVLVPHIYPLVHRAARGRGPFTFMFERLIAGGVGALNQTRASFGLAPLVATRDQYARAERMLLATYRCFDAPADDLLPNTRYVGPQMSPPPALPHGDGRTGAPLVVITFSTTYQHQQEFVQMLLGELGRMPVRGLFLTGPALGRETFAIPDNVGVEAFIPHADVLPRTAAIVTQGGHGTVMGALGHGVPLLCVPFVQDQPDTVRRIAELGAGLEVPRTCSPAVLRDALERILGTPAFREGALRVRERFLEEDDPSAAVRELESLCAVRTVGAASI